jgi:hypothetical protein
LLRRRCFEQCLKLLAHSSLFRGRCLRVAVKQHDCGGQVLRRSPEGRRGVTVVVGIDVRALVGASVVVVGPSPSRWRLGAGSGLLGSRMTLLVLVIPLTGLLLHGDHLWGWQRRGLWVAGFMVLPELPVEVGQLLVELAPSFCELVGAHPSLIVGGAVTWCWLWVGAARS